MFEATKVTHDLMEHDDDDTLPLLIFTLLALILYILFGKLVWIYLRN